MSRNLATLFVLMLAWAMITSSGCGGGPGTGNSSSSGGGNKSIGAQQSVSAFLQDAPSDSVVAFHVDLTSATLTDGGGNVIALSNTVQHVEMSHLALAPTFAYTAGVSATSFTTLTLNFASPQLNISDSLGNISLITATTTPSVSLATTSVAVPLTLSVSSNSNAGVILDFDARKSITLDAKGNFVVTPQISSMAVTDTDNTLELRDTIATISGLEKSPNGMDVKLLDSGQLVHVNVDSSTIFDSILTNFNNLQVGESVEVSAHFMSSGSYQGKFVSSGPSNPSLALQGVVAGTRTDNLGNAFFSIVVQ